VHRDIENSWAKSAARDALTRHETRRHRMRQKIAHDEIATPESGDATAIVQLM